METLTKKLKPYILLIGWLSTIITLLWTIFCYYYKFEENFKIIQKSTLRNTIWDIHVPLHDRIESCDNYLKLGYNSETKKYCTELLNNIDNYN